MGRLARARRLMRAATGSHWDAIDVRRGDEVAHWAFLNTPNISPGSCEVAASLALDGMRAGWRRVCWHCDKGWGHNVGGTKLGHAPSMNGDEKHAPRALRTETPR